MISKKKQWNTLEKTQDDFKYYWFIGKKLKAENTLMAVKNLNYPNK